MTKSEAEATTVVLNWMFGHHTDFDPAKLKAACLTLARGAHPKGSPWSEAKIIRQRW